jgi:hypothetical protein
VPSSTQILEGLTRIAREGEVVAVAWHVLLLLVLVALGMGWRPSKRLAALLLALPLASVALAALAFSNPFNATVFLIGTAILAALGARLPRERPERGSVAARLFGALMLAFGWTYPHFAEGGLLPYLYLAPIGLVPCPTLATVMGLALLTEGFGARAWPAVLAVLGLFYGIFGVFILGVMLDVGLVLGAAVLLGTSTFRKETESSLRKRAIPIL